MKSAVIFDFNAYRKNQNDRVVEDLGTAIQRLIGQLRNHAATPATRARNDSVKLHQGNSAHIDQSAGQ